MTIINNTLSLSKKEIAQGRNIAKGLTMNAHRCMIDKTVEKFNFAIPTNYQEKRSQLLVVLSNLGVSNKTLKQIKGTNTFGEFLASIMQFSRFLEKHERTIPPEKIKRTTSIPFQIEQEVYRLRNLRSNSVRNIHTIFNTKSTNPDVVKIENILKEEYGIKTALLGDDLVIAKEVLAAVKQAKSKGVNLPNEFIVSEFKLGGAEFIRTFNDGQELCTVLLPTSSSRSMYLCIKNGLLESMPEKYKQVLNKWKEFCGFKEHGSTNSPIHMETHEIMHQTHSPLVAFSSREIPAKFLPVVRKLSAYSAMNEMNNYEIYTELATKNVLGKLEPDEKELFKFLGGDV